MQSVGQLRHVSPAHMSQSPSPQVAFMLGQFPGAGFGEGGGRGGSLAARGIGGDFRGGGGGGKMIMGGAGEGLGRDVDGDF